MDLDRWGEEWGYGTSDSVELRRPSQSLSTTIVGSGICSFMRKALGASKSQDAVTRRLMINARVADGGLNDGPVC